MLKRYELLQAHRTPYGYIVTLWDRAAGLYVGKSVHVYSRSALAKYLRARGVVVRRGVF